MYCDLVKGTGIQSNQFLIIDGNNEAIIDPGGDLTYAPLSIEIGKHTNLESLDYILASHQDPDIISSLGRWVIQTNAKVVCSKLWSRFLPHLVPNYLQHQEGGTFDNRIVPLPDIGGYISLGTSRVHAIPAHFLHSVGNFQFYDEVSGILFSGDMGASLCDDDLALPVSDFNSHIPSMKAFHQRYMCSKKATSLWANMVKNMKVQKIVPQHGRYFEGENINKFLDWVSDLDCGIDLLTQKDYSFDCVNQQERGLPCING
ncbi:MAG: MBL fold metallo-hydrolase [Cellvibrionaceae bacterium]